MNLNTSIRIVMADDHSLVRDGIVRLLSDEKDFFIVGEAEGGKDLIKKYFELKPDLILADISMPDITGIDALTKIRQKDPDAKALFLSMHEGEEYIYYILKAGGKGLINKNTAKGELVYAIRRVYDGMNYFGSIWTDKKLEELFRRYESVKVETEEDFFDLSNKEQEIIKLIAEGLTSSDIADVLGLGKRTIDTHRMNIMQKLGIKSFPELIRYAIKFTSRKKGPENI